MENTIEYNRFRELKGRSGTHSPSIDVLLKELDLSIKVDACFLSNPYATELFAENLKKDFMRDEFFKGIIEYYPPQNRDISHRLSQFLGCNEKNIFIGNGAIEIIQAVLHNFVHGKIAVPIPTFSSYYEFIKPNTCELFLYQLPKENNFQMDLDHYKDYLNKNKINNAILINPNNPDGGYCSVNNVLSFLKEMQHLDNIIIDESFIHFAYETESLVMPSISVHLSEFRNVILIKSMSKDFGIAGIRAGYAIMRDEYVSSLLANGYLWNISGLTNYFFKLYTQDDFQAKYDVVRKKYIMNTKDFLGELKKIKGLEFVPSKANFVLIHVPENIESLDFMLFMLIKYGVYVRDCSDKIGLDGGYVRIACRSFEENIIILEALRSAYAYFREKKNNLIDIL